MKHITLTTALSILGMLSANAFADAGSGTVTFTGTVTDAPCNISANSVDQTVPFGLVSKSLLNKGNEVMKNFDIKLEQCDNTTLKTASVTFYGPNSSTGTEIKTSGVAKNVVIRLASADGKNVTLGTPVDAPMQGDSNTLRFTAYAKKSADVGAGDVTEGEFRSVADFRMSYK